MLRPEQLEAFTADHESSLLDDVSPRYLAGPGDARHVTHALAAAGWTVRSDPLTAVVDMISPDHLHRLRHEPQATWNSRTWQVSSNAPGAFWSASFGPVPAEILAGFTDGLLLPAPAKDLPEVWDLLSGAGWDHTVHPDGNAEARSPDGLVHIAHRPDSQDVEDPRFWRVEVVPRPDEGAPVWMASIRNACPAHLVHGLARALTAPAPLRRNWQQPLGHYRARRTESPMVPADYVRAHHDRVDSIRTRVRAARRHPEQAPTPSPPPSPALSSPRRQAR
ncbi:DUF317 domain-containing protein [Streptomyces sp. NPDC056716]|uniref:DUF317 domain-containing protein n=1 Tax=unclassified Streptomyces TaxID=2593676 RepID=UPI0036ACFED1